MRRPIIAGNWKMNTVPSSAAVLAENVKSNLSNCSWADIAVFPPYVGLTTVVAALKGSDIIVGGQNLFWEKEGAFTGAISAGMLAESGCRSVIIGHSERRTYFGETDERVNKKITAALAVGLNPIVCVGETLEQREADIAEEIIRRQVEDGLADHDDLKNITVAYEPVWAIGTGKNASPEQAGEIHFFIRNLVAQRWGKAAANEIRILYGGSVNPGNAAALAKNDDIDGFLIGGASLKADSFHQIALSVK